MKQVTLSAYAKINLSLDITGRRADGYHELDTVMQSVSLADTVRLVKIAGNAIALQCDRADLPQGPGNLAHQAAVAYFQAARQPVQGVSIFIKKQIPSQAGLGGGSADAAAVLRGLCTLFGNIPEDALLQAGASVGADVPFCLTGGCLRAQGIGEKLSLLPPLPHCIILIAKPAVGMSTAAAYAAYDRLPDKPPFHTGNLVNALSSGRLELTGTSLDNAFIKASSIPEIGSLCSALRAGGAVGTCMSGSGTAVFGLFAEQATARQCAASFANRQTDCFLCRPEAVGFRIHPQK